MISRNYQVRRRSLVTKKSEASRLLPVKRKALPRSYDSARRKIAVGASSRISDAVLLWRTSRGVRTFNLPISRQRRILLLASFLLFVVVSSMGWFVWQRGEIAMEKRRLRDSAALLREAHNAWLEGGGVLARSEEGRGLVAGAGALRSQALLGVLEPQLGKGEQREQDLRLLRDREDLKKDARRIARSLRRERSRSDDLSLERMALSKQNDRLRRDLQARNRDLSLQRTAALDAEQRRVGAEDRLASVESSALSLLKNLRGVLGSKEGRIAAEARDPVLAIRELARDVASEKRGRSEKLASYSESLDHAISGLERTVFALGIAPEFLEGLGYDLSPVLAANDAADGQSADEDMVSAGLGGPLDEEATESNEGYGLTFVDLEGRFERFDALRNLVGCMPLSHPLRGEGRFISGYGSRIDPFTREPAVHYGVDLGAWYDTSVYAGGKGRVSFTGYKSDYGRVVEIDHGCGFVTRYAHLSAIKVKTGDEVAPQTVIGKVGNTGRSTGPHLHYEVRLQDNPFDPKPFMSGVRDVF